MDLAERVIAYGTVGLVSLCGLWLTVTVLRDVVELVRLVRVL
jgi:hypothetical protein